MSSFIFRWRGFLLIPVALAALWLGRPSPASFALGLAVALLGEALRVWAVGYAGATTRESELAAPRLVTAGPYAFVRNPLYVGNCITALGFWIMTFVLLAGLAERCREQARASRETWAAAPASP